MQCTDVNRVQGARKTGSLCAQIDAGCLNVRIKHILTMQCWSWHQVFKTFGFIGNAAITFEDSAGDNMRLNERNCGKVMERIAAIGQARTHGSTNIIVPCTLVFKAFVF